jgi:4-carboxymuconolactone decarboxylase
MPRGSLTARQRALVGVSAALAARGEAGLRAALEAATRDAEPGEVEEVILQSHLFLGYPAALEGFSVWRRVARAAPEPLVEDHEACARRGEELGRTVYGRPWERLRDNVRELHPDLERWMVEEGYGRVLGRPGLDLLARELCVAALLAVLDLPRQLYAHARGALRVGASPEQVEEALAVAHDMSEPAARESARDTWRMVRDRFVRASGRRS